MNDVRVKVVEMKVPCSQVKVGDWFIVQGDKVHAPLNQGICFYALAGMAPFLPAWQMNRDSSDHIALGLTRFTCAQGKVVFEAERLPEGFRTPLGE
jgi:uncharacterized repeat protein (TIGR04076 family)